MLNAPFSLVGGILFLWLRGINLSVSAAVGFVSLFGVAVMSGVLVVSEINRRLRYDGTSLHEAVVSGSPLAQLRPVLLMIVVAMIGMVPAARATGIGSDVQRSWATVVVRGLVSTLLLTFLALPSLCYLLKRPACLQPRSEQSHFTEPSPYKSLEIALTRIPAYSGPWWVSR